MRRISGEAFSEKLSVGSTRHLFSHQALKTGNSGDSQLPYDKD